MPIIGRCCFFLRSSAALLLPFTVFLLLACELGEDPLAPKITGSPVTPADSVDKNMRIRALPSALAASCDDSAIIEVTVFDDYRNPIAGKEVLFSATAGVITAKDTSDADGVATAIFTAEAANKQVVISAGMKLNDEMISVATTVSLSGIMIRVVPQITAAPLNYPVPVTIILLDGKGKPLPDRQVRILGNGDSTKTTNGAGEVTTTAARASKGTITISAQAFGVADSAIVYFGSAVPVDSANNNMRIRILPSSLAASYDESAVAEVTVFDDNRNPVVGKAIRFTASKGVISAVDTTNGQGIATAAFTAEPINDNAIIYARMASGDSVLTVSTTVKISGLTLSVLPQLSSAPLNYRVPVKIKLLDAKGVPLPDRQVRIRGNGDTTKITNGAGEVTTLAVRPSSGTVTITATALGAADSATVFFGSTVPVDSSNRYMRIRAFPSALLASYSDTATIEVTVFDDNRNPIVNKEIMFSSSAGTVTALDTTSDDGIAAARFRAEPLNGNVIVTAKMKMADSVISAVTTLTLSGVAVVIIPQLGSAPLGAVVPVKIKLLDGTGAPLPDQQVRILGNGDSTKTTNGAGEVATAASRSSKGTVTITAQALGAVDSVNISFGASAPIDIDNTVRSLRLFSSHSQLRADNSASVTITAVLIGEDNHNPLVNETVQFASTLGIIDESGITDSTGRTRVTLRSTPVNGICVVRAWLAGNSAIKDSTSVLFSGVTVELSVDRNELRINDTAVVAALLKDGSGNPISSDFVNFAVGAPAVFIDGSRLIRSPLSATGISVVKVTSGTAGKVTVHAASANVTDSIVLSFTTNQLTAASAKSWIYIGGKDSTRISAQYFDQSGNPLSGKTITFATSAGSLTSTTAITNIGGIATTYLKSGYFAGEATVQAKSPDGSAFVTVPFQAAAPGSVTLAVTPDNIGINGGIAELIVTVRDDSGNVVSGAEVSFRIIKGPGGGEHIDKPIIATTNDGIARASLLAGSLPSTYRGCEVEATVAGLVAASRLTISGEPYTVTISRPEDDTVKVPNGGHMDESTFEFFIGAVVQDVNGNPVADGTPVNFSAVVSGMKVTYLAFDRWSGVESTDEIKPVYRWEWIDVPFEDVNGNRSMDPGIDLELDWNDAIAARGDDVDGNGTMDYNIAVHDFFWHFSGAEPYWPASKEYITITDPADPRYRSPDTLVRTKVGMIITPTVLPDSSAVTYDTNYVLVHDTSVMFPAIDSTYTIYADLNQNGKWDRSPAETDRDNDGIFDLPASGDFEFWRWEMRKQFKGDRLDFSNNDFAMVIDRTAVTNDGVASTRLTYPRQFAQRLIATVNAETKGIRDRDGERFPLPVIRD